MDSSSTMAQRPRASILSLFDPLSLSPTSDKENNAGEVSFFHPPGFPKPSPAAQRTLRRRLIDVGDMTIDEPDMQHFLEMEDELEELSKHITEDDDGDTLTWRDMAKAATPKWSGRHATSFTTPKSSPTPRTPLAEISFKEETTPMARKKSYRRLIVSGPSKLAQVDVPPERSIPESSSLPLNTSSDEASLPVSPPSIQISSVDIDVQGKDSHTTFSPSALGSSICTLNLPTTNDNLLADASLPLSISQSSSQSLSQSSLSPTSSTLLTPPLPQARLRPDSHSKAPVDNRMSIDLQSSFQLHMSSSDASFDLLNEKISFFSSKDGNNSFLNNLEIDDSFGDEDFAVVNPKTKDVEPSDEPPVLVDSKPAPAEEPTGPIPKTSTKSPRPESLRVFVPKLKPTIQIDDESGSQDVLSPISNDIHESHDHVGSNVIVQGPLSAKLPSPIRSPSDEKDVNVLSTPSSTNSFRNPLDPVPALKIVKRSKILFRRISTTVNTASTSNSISTTSRRTSSVSFINPPAGNPPPIRARNIPSVSSSPAIDSGRNGSNGSAPQLTAANPKKTAAPSFSNPSVLSGDGPRRVLVSDGPKLNSVLNTRTIGHSEPTKAPLAVNGPRRIVVNTVAKAVEKPAVVVAAKPVAAPQANVGFKQPIKYNTIGTSSGIPKPVSRTAGSRLPAPANGSSKPRFGVPTVATGASVRGLPGRRVI